MSKKNRNKLKKAAATTALLFAFTNSAIAAPSMIEYVNSTGDVVSADYNAALAAKAAGNPAMLDAIKAGISSAQNGFRNVFITDDQNRTINWTTALNAGKAYQDAEGSVAYTATAPTPTKQLNTSGNEVATGGGQQTVSVSTIVATNTSATITFNSDLATAPKATELVMKDYIGTDTVGSVITLQDSNITLGADKRTVTVTLQPIAATAQAQSVVIGVSYKGATEVKAAAYTIPAVAATTSVTANNQPAAANIGTGSSRNPVFKFQVTAGATDLTFTQLTVNEYGSAASNATDISRIYLMDGNTVLTSGTLNSSQAKLNGTVTVKAGQTKEYTLACDIAAGAAVTAGVQLGIDAASSFTTSATLSGTFPLKGNTFNIVAQSVGGVTVSAGTLAATTYRIGTQQANLGGFTLAANANEALKVNKLVVTANGLNNTSFSNFYLYSTNGTTKINTAGQVSGNTVVFDLSANPISISAGQSTTLTLKGDIIGGNGNAGTFQIANTYDVASIGINSNSTVVTTLTGGAAIALSAGNITIATGSVGLSNSTATPLSQIVASANTPAVVREWVLQTGSEDLVINSVAGNVSVTTGADARSTFANFYLYDGDTNTQIAGPVAAIAANTVTFNPVNYLVSANSSKKLQVRATWVANDTGVDVVLQNGGISYTLQTSNTTATLPTGATMPAAAVNKAWNNAGTLSSAVSPSTPVASRPIGSTGASLAKYMLGAGTIDDVVVTSVNLTEAAGQDLRGAVANVGVYVNGTLYGVKSTVPSNNTGSFALDLTSNPLTIAKGTTVEIEIKGDIIGNPAANNFTFNYASANGYSKTTNIAVSEATARAGGVITTNATGALTLAGPSGGQITAGTVAANTTTEFVKGYYSANNVEDLTLKQVQLTGTAGGAYTVPVKNIEVLDGTTVIATYPGFSAVVAGTTVVIPLTTPVTITKNTGKVITFRGQLDTSATSGNTVAFSYVSTTATPGGTDETYAIGSMSGAVTEAAATTAAAGALTKVNASVNIALASDSPTGTIALGPSTKLMHFTITASGGDVSIPIGSPIRFRATGNAVPANAFDDNGEFKLYRGTSVSTGVQIQAGTNLVTAAGVAGNRTASISGATITVNNGETADFIVVYDGLADLTNPWTPSANQTLIMTLDNFPINDSQPTAIRAATETLSSNALKF